MNGIYELRTQKHDIHYDYDAGCMVREMVDPYRVYSNRFMSAGCHYKDIKIEGSNTAKEAVKKIYGKHFDSLNYEEFHIMCLNTQNKVIILFRITVGILDASLVHPREVFRPAIHAGASAIILVHNHPSGDSTPSRADHAVTRRAREIGTTIGIDVLDSVVYGSQESVASLHD